MNQPDMTRSAGLAGKPPFREQRCTCGAVMLINVFTMQQKEFVCGACRKFWTWRQVVGVRRDG